MSDMHKSSSSLIFSRARYLRKKQTKAENILWSLLRGRKLNSLKFRRQHPLMNYVADFYCHELSLIIEVDGNSHHKEEQRAHDHRRQKELELNGIKVIRFTNEEIIEDSHRVLRKIKEYAENK